MGKLIWITCGCFCSFEASYHMKFVGMQVYHVMYVAHRRQGEIILDIKISHAFLWLGPSRKTMADDGERNAKRRTINDLRFSVPFVSQAALEAICKDIAAHGLPEKHKRHDIWKETKDCLENPMMSTYGPLLQTASLVTSNDTKQKVCYINFLSLLSGAFLQSGAFTNWLLEFHSQFPSSHARPWEAVAYCDEMHPGNMLHSTSRKTWCVYLSFLQLKQLLSKSDCWFCICIIRTSEASNLQAGMSQVFRVILELIFGEGEPEAVALLTSEQGSLRLHFTLGMVLQDGAAQKHIWANRQDSGSKPCFWCKDLFQLKDKDSDGRVFSQFLKHEQLQVASGQEVISSWQRMRERSQALPLKEFDKWQQAAGLTYNGYALMSSEKLQACGLMKRISLYCFDYMHGMRSNGVFQDTIYLVLESITPSEIKVWDRIKPWIELWVLPQAYSCNLGKLFDTKNVSSSRKARDFTCSASKVLALYKLLQQFLSTMYVANNVMVEQGQCFLAWAEVLDFLTTWCSRLQPQNFWLWLKQLEGN